MVPTTIDCPSNSRRTRATARSVAPGGGSRLLALTVALGAALRVWGLGRFPFEQDELYTIIESRYLFHSPLTPGIQARPLYFLLQHQLLQLAPVSEAWLRLLPFLFGLGGIVATWFLGRRLFGVRGASVAALLVAVSPWHLYASGMARYWSLIYLLSTLACLFLVNAYQSDRPADYLGALLALLLGVAAHPSFAFPIVGVVLGLTLVRNDARLGWRWPSRRGWTWLWVPFAVAVTAAALALLLTGNQGAVQNWATRGLAGSVRLIPAMVQWMGPVIFVAGGLGALTLTALAREPARRSWGLMALLGCVSGMAGLVAASMRTSVYADYGIGLLPLLLVSAAGLVTVGAERIIEGGRAFTGMATLVLCASVFPSLASDLSDGMRFDYRPAFRRIAAASPELPVLSTPIILQRFYAPRLHGQELRMSAVFLDSIARRTPDFWVILGERRSGVWLDSGGQVGAWVDRHCRRAFAFERPRFDYRLYRTDLYRCSGAAPP